MNIDALMAGICIFNAIFAAIIADYALSAMSFVAAFSTIRLLIARRI